MPSDLLFLLPMLFILLLLLVGIFQWLWNTTMPEAFGLKEIRYWVAFRLLLLATILTSGELINLKLS